MFNSLNIPPPPRKKSSKWGKRCKIIQGKNIKRRAINNCQLSRSAFSEQRSQRLRMPLNTE